jgi:hypothetical protein
MPPGKSKLEMDGSWVVEGDDEDSEHSPQQQDETPPPRISPRRSVNRSPEPEFRMPPLDPETLSASWADTTSRSTRFQKGRRSPEIESRRRATRQTINNGSSETRPKAKNQLGRAPRSDSASTPPLPEKEANNFQDILDVLTEHTFIMFSYLYDILGFALRFLKKPIGYAVAIWLLFGLSVLVRNLVTNSVYASLSPICRIPGASFLDLPFCPTYRVDTSNGSPPPVEFDQLMTMQSKFEEVMEESAGSVSLPMDMKRGEASIRDLRQLVRYSHLNSK